MKALTITILTAIFLANCVWGGLQFYWDYQYNNSVGSYFKLSDAASDTTLKLDYLKQYQAALKNANIPDDFHPALIAKRPDNQWGNKMVVLNTLITRLDEATKLDRKSFEYQQSISQITGQEYQAFDESYYENAYLWHKYGAWYWLGWVTLVGVLGGGLLIFVVAAS